MGNEFVMPELNLVALAPVLVILGAACLALPLEAFVPRHLRNFAQTVLALVAIAAAAGWSIRNFVRIDPALGGGEAFAVDRPSYFVWWALLLCTALCVLLFAERGLERGRSAFTSSSVAVPGTTEEAEAEAAGLEHTEVFPLAMFALGGMMLFASANDLLVLFIALEVMSLPLYLLCGLARRRRLVSQESALKYFLLGALSSAILLMGIALMYGYAGGFTFGIIGKSIPAYGVTPLFMAALALILVGLLFKIGAVPFHSWVADVYQGAPTPVTAFMSACVKMAAVVALARFLFAATGEARWSWQPLIAVICVLTIIVGTYLAVRQADVKRLLAYSSVAHAGFILAAILGATTYTSNVAAGQLTSMSAVLFYLLAYGLGTIAAFAMVQMVREKGAEATHIDAWRGLGRRHPLFSFTFSFLLLSFAGIPLTSGFVGKAAVFFEAWRGGFWWVVVIGVLMSVVAAYFYTKLIIVMFFTDADEDRQVDVVLPGFTTRVPVAIGVLATIVMGIVPGPVLELAMRASEFIR